jgi:hypothetical protein
MTNGAPSLTDGAEVGGRIRHWCSVIHWAFVIRH